MKSNSFLIFLLLFFLVSGCSSRGGIPIVREIGQIVNIPIEIVQNIIGVGYFCTTPKKVYFEDWGRNSKCKKNDVKPLRLPPTKRGPLYDPNKTINFNRL